MKTPEEIIKSEGLFKAAKYKYTSNHIIDLIKRIQDDARKTALMEAQYIASEVINAESPKYAQPNQQVPAELTLSGLNFKVTSAITAKADALAYLS